MKEKVVAAFHRTARLTRADLFDNDALLPTTAVEDARTAAPGWVGDNWSGGTLMVGINPGGGGDAYRRNPDDDRLYAALRKLRDAGAPAEQEIALINLSSAWIAIQRSHNIWRIVDPILKATGEASDTAAFMNILPFRTREDKAPSVGVLRRAWALSALPQIEALQPARIIALGKKAWDALSRFDPPPGPELILFKRGIGDSYIPSESNEVLARLAHERANRAS
jgi:hypothetical protein